ncbi:MAG: hypothetical protein LKH79_05755 [Heyndrickxia oleronia]|uniref:hypothetical protein n=2 Tax=Heyndrickxia oleronia TaxID=38875 RepID=UPI002431B5B7|nr:hypothetical protein [Heyndrickxia oleronia]MCI1590042.1 hypothetical protein [Heyndrickxia oleronia]MCI1613733.1 hypothetical protein [Heyndrickxia oleronia]
MIMAIDYGLVPNESFESLYSEICLSHNQVKQMLNHYLNSIRNMTIQLNEETLIKLTKVQVVDVLLENLKRKEIVELIHMLTMINQRQSDVSSYMKYILSGILAYKEKKGFK